MFYVFKTELWREIKTIPTIDRPNHAQISHVPYRAGLVDV